MTAHIVTTDHPEGSKAIGRTEYTVQFGHNRYGGEVKHTHPVPARLDFNAEYEELESFCNLAGIPLQVITLENGSIQRFIDLNGEKIKLVLVRGKSLRKVKAVFIERPKAKIAKGISPKFQEGNFAHIVWAYVFFQSFHKLNDVLCRI